MLDIKYIKANKEKVKATVKNRGIKGVDIDQVVTAYDDYSDLLKKVELHRSLKNRLSEDISKVTGDVRNKLVEEASKVKNELKDLEAVLVGKEAMFSQMLIRVPNVASEKMPVGSGEEDNVVLKVWLPESGYLQNADTYAVSDVSYMPQTKFNHLDHIELGERLDILDIEQSAKVSGSRFSYIKNELAVMQDAISFMLKKELLKRGFKQFIPPILVRERALFGTSHFPEGIDQVYKIENKNVEDSADLYLIGSSEPANFSYFMDKVLDAGTLPRKIFAQTACFRSEVGSWGKDVKGIKRVHQFDKLEMNAVCLPEQAESIFGEFLAINEWVLQQLELPYRVINKCTGDCGYNASHYQNDFEVWRPGAREFMEAGTDTNTTDYQARRFNIRYKNGDVVGFAYTVNDTGIAFGRALLAILENYQQPDGSVKVPEVLVDYCGFDTIKL